MTTAAIGAVLDEQYLRLLIDDVPDALVATDPKGRVTLANPAAQALYGISESDALGRDLAELLGRFDAGEDGSLAEITAIVAHEGHWHGEISQRTPSGQDVLVEASVSLLRDHRDGTVLGSVSIMREISDRKAAERLVAHQATHDSLTGLLNRAAFMDSLHQSLAGDRRPSLAFVDLNGFKEINDSYGHDAGDEILRVVAERLRAGIRPTDVIGRFGGDEFVLLARDLPGSTATRHYLERLTALFGTAIDVNGTPHLVGASIGVARARLGDTAASLLRRADKAMYAAKRRAAATSTYRVEP